MRFYLPWSAFFVTSDIPGSPIYIIKTWSAGQCQGEIYMKFLILIFFCVLPVSAQEIIEISVKGISDAVNDGAQKDRMEAIMDAKHQACEKAGVKIEAKTTVENFQTVYDLIESRSETVLLPGFQIIDIGYVQDGTYQVVLSGKIQVVEQDEQISAKELRYAKSLRDRGNHAQCEAILKKYIDNDDPEVPDALKEEALYLYIKWGYSWSIEEHVQKFAAYYPESAFLSKLEAFAAFSREPLYVHDHTYSIEKNQWKTVPFSHEEYAFNSQITVAADTVIFKDFQGHDQTFILHYRVYITDEESIFNSAYASQLFYYDGDILKKHPGTDAELIDDRFKPFRRDGSATFQHSSSGVHFHNFGLKYFQISGDVPKQDSAFQQKISFKIFQQSF